MTLHEEQNRVQKAMNSTLSGLREDPWLAQRILANAKGEAPVKKKLSFAAALVIAILTIGATVAVAEMLGLNVFELFGQTDGRYREIAPYTVLEQTSEVSVTTVELGTTVAAINSAYYDGQSLMVAYSIQNGLHRERFSPDDALLAKMTRDDEPAFWAVTTDEEWALSQQWSQALTEGAPMGIVTYSVYPSDHTTTDDGVDIPPIIEDSRKGDDGVEYTIREYETPLAEELQNLDSLTLNIRLYQSVSYLYYDGSDVYTFHERQELQPMKAIVWKTNAAIKAFTGKGRYNGVEYEVSVQASAANAQLEMRFKGDAPPQLPDHDHWYVIRLTNENGEALRITESDDSEPGKLRCAYEGTGIVPAELTLRIYVAHEGDFDEEAAINEALPVVLTQKEL